MADFGELYLSVEELKYCTSQLILKSNRCFLFYYAFLLFMIFFTRAVLFHWLQVIHQLKQLGTVWQDVLPVSIYCKAMGNLLNTAITEIIAKIMMLEVCHLLSCLFAFLIFDPPCKCTYIFYIGIKDLAYKVNTDILILQSNFRNGCKCNFL